MSVSVDVSEINKLASLLGGAAVKVATGAPAATRAEAEQIAADARADAPVFSGELLGSIEVQGSGMSYEIGSPTRQGFYQEVGTSVMAPQQWLTPNADPAVHRLGEKVQLLGVLW